MADGPFLPGFDTWPIAPKGVRRVVPRVCQCCGESFPIPVTAGRPARFCGHDCRLEWRANMRVLLRAVARFERSEDRWNRVRRELCALLPALRPPLVRPAIWADFQQRKRRHG